VGAGTGALIGRPLEAIPKAPSSGWPQGHSWSAGRNAVDQDDQAARDAAQYNKPVIYYDKNGGAVEAIPEGTGNPNCRKITKRIWENGQLIKETVEEVCDPLAVRYYAAPRCPLPITTGGGDGLMSLVFFFLWTALLQGVLRYRPYPHYHGWHRW